MIFSLVLTALAALHGSAKPHISQPDALCLNPSRLYADLNDCRKFIRCVNRKPVTFSCPSRTTFDPETQICTWRSDLDDCHHEDTVTPPSGSSVTDNVKSKPVVDEVTIAKSVVTDIWGPSKYVSTKYEATVRDVQTTKSLIDKPAVRDIQTTKSLIDKPAVRDVQTTTSFIDKPAVRDVQTASLIDRAAVRDVQTTTSFIDKPAVRDVQTTTNLIDKSAGTEHEESTVSNSAANGKIRVTDGNLVKDGDSEKDDNEKASLDLPEVISDRPAAPTDQINTRQRGIDIFSSRLVNSNESSQQVSLPKTDIPHTQQDSVTRSLQETTETSQNANVSRATYTNPILTTTTITNSLIKSADPSRQMYLLLSENQEYFTNLQEIPKSDVATSNQSVSYTTFRNDTITDTRHFPRPQESQPTFPTKNNTSVEQANISHRMGVNKTDGLDLLNVNISLAKHSIEQDTDLNNQETDISVDDDNENMSTPTTLSAVTSTMFDLSTAEADTKRDNFSFNVQLDIFDGPDNIFNINNVTNYNKHDDPEDNRIQGSDQLDKNVPQEVDQEIQQPILDVKNSSQDFVLHEEIHQSKESDKHHSILQSDSVDTTNELFPTILQSDSVDTTNELFSTHAPKQTTNIDSNDITSPRYTFQVSPESTSSLIETSSWNHHDSPSQINEDAQILYSHTPRSVELNISVTAGDIGLTTPSPDISETEAVSERPLASPYRALEFNIGASVTYTSQIPLLDLTTRTRQDPTTLPTSSSTEDIASTQQDVAQMYDVPTSSTPSTSDSKEKSLNFSFKSVPYMVKGLVRPFRCPEQDGHFLEPSNCSVYYHCTGGQAYRRDCASGQVFHLAALSCVSQTLAPPCSTTDDDLQEERAVAEDVYQCQSDGHFRDPNHCNVYYICVAGNSMRMTCDPGTSFDPTFNLCMWNSDVLDCKSTKVASRRQTRKDNLVLKTAKKVFRNVEPTEDELHLIHEDYNCQESDGVFPDPNNCSVYHVCDGGRARRKVCPRGTGYDVVEGLCMDSWRLIRCVIGSSYEERQHDTVPTEQSNSFICPEAHGLYPDPDNCSIFIHCFKKIPYRHKCRPDTVFNSETGVCTWRELVPECQSPGDRSGSTGSKSYSAVASLSLPIPQDVPFVPYKQVSSDNESPEPVAQGHRVDIQDFTCPDVADGFFRDNLFCDIFHRCVFRTRFTFTCPTGTFFRLRGNMCDFWESVTDCTKDGLRLDAMRSLPEFAKLPVTLPTPNDLDLSNAILDADPTPCPESSGLFPHPRNCRQFLFCAHSVPLVLTCPETLLYNPQTLTCDLSKNVRCLRYDDYAKK